MNFCQKTDLSLFLELYVYPCQDFVQQTEDTIQTIVHQLMESQQKQVRTHECTCTGTTLCDKANCKNKQRIISPKSHTPPNATATNANLVHNRYVSSLPSHIHHPTLPPQMLILYIIGTYHLSQVTT